MIRSQTVVKWVVMALVAGGLAGCHEKVSNENDLPGDNQSETLLGTGTTWQIQLSGALNTTYGVDLYDADLFDMTDNDIATLHDAGKSVICYFSAGSYENWRSDAAAFPDEVIGNALDGWEGESWLDIRSEAVRQIMRNRLDLAKERGCDGVDPDNVDGYTNDPGFPLTSDDQLAYNRFLADEAHARGLLIGLKNDLDQIESLAEYFDFSVNEQCHEYDECDMLEPFIDLGKPVFNIEYKNAYKETSAFEALCADSGKRKFQTLLLPLALDDSFRYSCTE